ncbi:hypothetical protein LCGC14_1427400 [marine sediment metagenome]|uniref:CAAX prenyl protease 2/Lysostaphin resistance protein A-like domain-containing protein n=1 Tax=marine sediment metagenome TaxID=412755 RepID=A0A0F9KAT0_9ZZZZ
MAKDNKSNIKYCVYCGANVEEGKIYCPSCGKLIIKIKPGKKITKPVSGLKIDISRKCPGCGSIITSTILDQCPICNTLLEKLSEVKKASIQTKPGLIFTNKKLELEQKFLLKKDTWNLKEGTKVFGTCIYALVIIFFLLFIILTFQLETNGIPVNILTIVLSQIPELIFGIYPIWYIYNKKHSYRKLGFYSDSRKVLLAILIGVLGTGILLLINYFSNSFVGFIADAGLDFFELEAIIDKQNQVIRDTDLLGKLLLTILISFGAISAEIVFRGVLHNTLKEKFTNDYQVILIVAFAYSLMMLLFSVPIGLIFFLTNFVSFTVLGILYKINGNIYNTIIANTLYNVVIMVIIFL